MATNQQAALGFRTHSGWAVVVAVALRAGKPVVLERRRLETADTGIRGSKQPFHAAERLDFQKAEAHIRTCMQSSSRLATDAVTAFVNHLTQAGHQVSASGIVFGAGRPLPELAAILQSHALIHTAEGEFFRETLVHASGHCGLAVTKVKEREVWERAAASLRLGTADLQERIAELGRSLGPPWRQDEKLASLAGWIALAEK